MKPLPLKHAKPMPYQNFSLYVELPMLLLREFLEEINDPFRQIELQVVDAKKLHAFLKWHLGLLKTYIDCREETEAREAQDE